MALTLTAAQEAALKAGHQPVVYAVKIDLATDLLYCTGYEAVTLDSETYTPRGMEISGFQVTSPWGASASVTIDDMDGEVSTAWYTERFSSKTVTISKAIYKDGAWVLIRAMPWICTTCERDDNGQFTLKLSGAAGLLPKFGLTTATRADFPLAPEEGLALRIGGTIVKVV